MALKPPPSPVLPTILALLAAATLTTDLFAQGAPPAPVAVGRVTVERLQDRRRVTGELRAVARSRVATAEEGLVLECPVDEGDPVRAGDVLAVLDARRLEAEGTRLEAAAAVASAVERARTAERDRALRDLEVLRDLAKRSAANINEIADAERDLDIATAHLDEAKRSQSVIAAERELLDLRLGDMRITAPFDGVVVDVPIDVGEWVSAGDPIVEVIATARYEAWLDVPERLRPALARADTTATVDVAAVGMHAPNAPIRVVPLVDPVARTFRVIVTVDDHDGTLAAGMSASAWLPTGEMADHITVPRDAVLRNDVGAFVYVVRDGEQGSVALPAQVSVLFDHGERVAVRGRIEPGATVVVEGNESLFPGSPVVIARQIGVSAQEGTH